MFHLQGGFAHVWTYLESQNIQFSVVSRHNESTVHFEIMNRNVKGQVPYNVNADLEWLDSECDVINDGKILLNEVYRASKLKYHKTV